MSKDDASQAVDKMLLDYLLNQCLGRGERRAVADHFRYIAAGEPEFRQRIVERIEQVDA